jgi:hypothetical protein
MKEDELLTATVRPESAHLCENLVLALLCDPS